MVAIAWPPSKARSSAGGRTRRAARRSSTASTSLLAEIGADPITEAEQFAGARERAAQRRAELDDELASTQNQLNEVRFEHKALQDEAQGINDELHSLQSRRSNLPRTSLELRERLCSELAVASDELPFAGELIQVRADAAMWEGAAERVLHSSPCRCWSPTGTTGRWPRGSTTIT